ncbi:MAG: aminoglycoside 6-adenylyltransferase [Chloroflexi bacterium]|nr:aminoglycoside 6-adenylyltransferase [Chloroflexota bacterium]
MHHVLTDSLKRLEDYFSQDDRCIGMYLWGSLSNHSADEWSDVDVAAVFRDEDYAALKAEFRAICERLCGPILVLLPEGENAEFVNDAFLFEAEDRLHLYDFTILSVGFLQKATWLRPQQVLFDKTGALAAAASRETVPTFKPDGLRRQIDNYWVYTYLNGKYYKRRDTYKMLYVQGVIFQTHMQVLHALYPDAEWHWWARDIHTLPEAQQAELMIYFVAHQPDDIGRALQTEMALFSRDAQAACQKWGVAYPAELERGVREHLTFMGVTG